MASFPLSTAPGSLSTHGGSASVSAGLHTALLLSSRQEPAPNVHNTSGRLKCFTQENTIYIHGEFLSHPTHRSPHTAHSKALFKKHFSWRSSWGWGPKNLINSLNSIKYNGHDISQAGSLIDQIEQIDRTRPMRWNLFLHFGTSKIFQFHFKVSFPLHACLSVPRVSSAICILSLRYAWPFSQELVSSAGQSFSYSQPVCLFLRLHVQPQGTPDLKAQRRCTHDILLKEGMWLPEFQTSLVQTFI